MLIDKKGINNTFEAPPEMLFGTYITGWRCIIEALRSQGYTAEYSEHALL